MSEIGLKSSVDHALTFYRHRVVFLGALDTVRIFPWDVLWYTRNRLTDISPLGQTIVATLLTSIGSHFNRAHQSSYLGSAYLLSVCCFTPLYGRLSDIIGESRVVSLSIETHADGRMQEGKGPCYWA